MKRMFGREGVAARALIQTSAAASAKKSFLEFTPASFRLLEKLSRMFSAKLMSAKIIFSLGRRL